MATILKSNPLLKLLQIPELSSLIGIRNFTNITCRKRDYKKFIGQFKDSELSEIYENWNKLKIKWKLVFGLAIKVKSHAEWKAYNDIFVDREYDVPIKQALASTRHGHTFIFLDLGANVKFFTTRLTELIFIRFFE